jgi:hypothetical protein
MEWQHDFSKMFKNGTTDYRPEQQPCKFTVATSVTIMQIHSNNHANSHRMGLRGGGGGAAMDH